MLRFTIRINPDSLNEGNETFAVTLSNANNAKFAGDASSTKVVVTIVDDEVPILSVENLSTKL